MKILVAGELSNYCLETSYVNGFKKNGHEVATFDIKKHIRKYVRLGRIGNVVNTFLPVEAWIKKANRELILFAKEFRPDVLICAANGEVLAGSIAFLKSILPVKIILIWPDTLFNLGRNVLVNAPFFDLVAAHSSTAVTILRQYGFKNVEWLPFGGDIDAHYLPRQNQQNYEFDLTFVGGCRPEREKVIALIIDKFPSLKVKVWGPYWDRAQNKKIRSISIAQPLYGKAFSSVVQKTFLNLNIIDDTNCPGSNMRFFEIPAAGGIQLCSACPELEPVYKNAVDLFYFHSDEELLAQIEHCLSNRGQAEQTAVEFQKKILERDNYWIRSEELLRLLQ